jgi:hypothetical protein
MISIITITASHIARIVLTRRSRPRAPVRRRRHCAMRSGSNARCGYIRLTRVACLLLLLLSSTLRCLGDTTRTYSLAFLPGVLLDECSRAVVQDASSELDVNNGALFGPAADVISAMSLASGRRRPRESNGGRQSPPPSTQTHICARACARNDRFVVMDFDEVMKGEFELRCPATPGLSKLIEFRRGRVF